jgi:Tfp pilus assembly protein PilN
MVNINLLEKEKLRKKRQRSFFKSPEKSNSRFLAYAVMVLAVCLTFFFHWNAKTQLAEASSLRTELQEQSAKLKAIQIEAEKFEKIKNQTLDRINAIEDLKRTQSDPLQLMNSLIKGISSGSSIWLTKLTREGSYVSIQGHALNVPAIADLIEVLQKSPPFSKVEINYWEVQASSIEFDLNCEIMETETEGDFGGSMVEK